ncbi:MAG: leucine-rich repeat domain-containing protein [Treponema sp.]|nr:leucine-rich repeat domain-containing protein [Treponema sp.]
MEYGFIRKKGLLFSQDMLKVIGVDDTSGEFTGKIPYGPKYVDDDVFSECPYEQLIFPDSVEKLGSHVLENSLALEYVKLPSSLTELPEYLFSGCRALSSVSIPLVVTDFPEGLFQNCESVKEIPFRTGLTVLHKNVFRGCFSLKSLVIPESVKKIESFACADCVSLESLILPSKIECIEENAFENCNSLRSIRIDSENPDFFISEEGNLCSKKDNKIIIKVSKKQEQEVKFFNDNLNDNAMEIESTSDLEMKGAFFLSDEEVFEEDDTFYSLEIGASDEEINNINIEENYQNKRNLYNNEEVKMIDENNVDSMLADIMGEKKESETAANVSVNPQELEILSHTMSVMEDSSQTNNSAAITTDELEKLFEKNEENTLASQKVQDETNKIDPKIQILVDSVEFGKILTFEPKNEVPEDPDLFVIAEKTITDEAGNKCFTPKLISCCKTFARIHDFEHVVLVSGIPFDNDEFMQFFHHYIVKKNVILACEASSPSTLSDYCKKVCEEARISLNSAELNDQRKRISIKTNTLIKLVIKDKYDC